MGIIIKSPEIAGYLADRFYELAPNLCYEPFLDERGRLRWRDRNDGEVDIVDHEPDTTYYQRLKATLGRALPIRGQL